MKFIILEHAFLLTGIYVKNSIIQHILDKDVYPKQNKQRTFQYGSLWQNSNLAKTYNLTTAL